MSDHCFTKLSKEEVLKEIFGEHYDKVDKQILKSYLDEADAIKKAADRSELTPNEMFKQLNETMKRVKQENAINIKDRTDQKLAEIRVMRRVRDFENSVEGLFSIISSTHELAKGNAVSIEHIVKGRDQKHLTAFYNKLQKENLLGILETKSMDMDIAIARERLALGQDTKGLPQEALKIAKILNDTYDKLFADKRLAGIAVNYKKNYQFRQTHDGVKLRAAGYEKWKEDILRYGLDIEKSFGKKELETRGLDTLLREHYDHFLKGQYAGAEKIDLDGRITGIDSEQSIGKVLAAHRRLNFKDAQGSMSYKQTYGTAESLLASVIMDIRSSNLKSSLYEILGPKPRETLKKTMDTLMAEYKRTGDTVNENRLGKEYKSLQAVLENVMGSPTQRGSEALRRKGRILADWNSMTFLGFTGARSVANPANIFMASRGFSGKSLGQDLYDAVAKTVGAAPEAFKQTTGRSIVGTVNKDLARDMADGLDYMNEFLAHEMRTGVAGVSGKMVDIMMRLNQQDLVNKATSAAIVNKITTGFGEHAEKAWKDLPTDVKSAMLRMEIDDVDWNVMRLARTEILDENGYGTGKFHLDPDAFDTNRAMYKEAKNVMAFKGLKTTPEKYLRKMENAYRSFLQQYEAIATTTAGARSYTRAKFGTESGTYAGEFVNAIMQFKSFTFEAYLNSRKFLNQAADPEALARGDLQTKKLGGKEYASLAVYSTMATSMALAANAFLRYANGQEPEDYRDYQTYLSAVAKSPIGGMYVDVLSGPWNKYSWAETAAGPTFGRVARGMSAFADVREGLSQPNPKKSTQNFKKAAMTATQVVRSAVPFQQMLGIRAGLHYMENEVVRETLWPNSGARFERRKAREQLDKLLWREGIEE